MKTTTYYKKTYSGLLTNLFSFTPFSYKVGLAKILIDRAYKINSYWTLFENNLRIIKHNLQKKRAFLKHC